MAINKTYTQDSLAESFVLYKKNGKWVAEAEVSYNSGARTVRKAVAQSEFSGAELSSLSASLQLITDKAGAKVGEGDF